MKLLLVRFIAVRRCLYCIKIIHLEDTFCSILPILSLKILSSPGIFMPVVKICGDRDLGTHSHVF
jgi:hypothetical protein